MEGGYQFHDGFFVIEDLPEDFQAQSNEEILSVLLKHFNIFKKANVTYGKYKWNIGVKKVNIQTKCECNMFALNFEWKNLVLGKLEVEVRKKSQIVCKCEKVCILMYFQFLAIFEYICVH
jgi:hypothetical protein